MPRRVDAGNLQRRDRRQAVADGEAHRVVNMAFRNQVACQLVIRGVGAIDRVVRVDQRKQVNQIPLGAAFAQQNVQAQPQFFPRLLQPG